MCLTYVNNEEEACKYILQMMLTNIYVIITQQQNHSTLIHIMFTLFGDILNL